MQFGIVVDSQYSKDVDIGRRIDEMVLLTERARDSGYQSLFAVHHYLSSNVTLQPLPTLARLIPHSGTMRLGTGVYFATVEHPIRLAENTATIDQLSGGRLILGLGAGYRREEFAATGVERATRWSRLAETVDLVEALWTGEPVDHRGEYFEVRGQRISVAPAQAAATADLGRRQRADDAVARRRHRRRLARAAQRQGGWAIGNLAAFQAEQERLGRARPGADVPIMRELFVADTDAEAEARAVDFVRREYAEVAQHDLDHFVSMFDDLVRKAFLIGSPETIRRRIEELAAAGFDHLIFRVRWADMPVERRRREPRAVRS